MISPEPYLLDTNVLVYAVDQMSPYHKAASSLANKGFNGDIQACVSPQILSEFFATVTNPKVVSATTEQKEVVSEMRKYFVSSRILKIYPTSATLKIMLDLLDKYAVSRQDVYDLQLVATMLSNNITTICTYDVNGFRKYQGIEVLTPDAILR